MYEALRAVPGLRFGRTETRETEPIKPVPWAWVEPVWSAVSAEVAAMIWLHWLTGMRPCEAVIMRACDIDMSGEVWLSTMAISLLPHVSRVEVVNQSVIERISGLLVGSKTVSVAPMREMLVVDRLLLHNA